MVSHHEKLLSFINPLQVNIQTQNMYRGIWHCVQSTYRNEGVSVSNCHMIFHIWVIVQSFSGIIHRSHTNYSQTCIILLFLNLWGLTMSPPRCMASTRAWRCQSLLCPSASLWHLAHLGTSHSISVNYDTGHLRLGLTHVISFSQAWQEELHR